MKIDNASCNKPQYYIAAIAALTLGLILTQWQSEAPK